MPITTKQENRELKLKSLVFSRALQYTASRLTSSVRINFCGKIRSYFSSLLNFLKRNTLLALISLLPVFASAQDPLVAGANINMVSGTEFPGGDPFLQRQNEPSLAVSTRNNFHLLAGANDYRTVDVPGLTNGKTVGDSWPGVFSSVNGGGSWVSTLISGYPQDTSATGLNSPLKGYEAGADPVIRAGTNGLFYYSGIVFDRGQGGESAVFVSRFMDLNNDPTVPVSFEQGPIRFIDTNIVACDAGELGGNDIAACDPDEYPPALIEGESGPEPARGFIDKPWLAVDIPRSISQEVELMVSQAGGTVSQLVDCGPLYMAYAQITGEDTNDIDSHIMFTSSYDCGAHWTTPKELDGIGERSINQGTSVAIDPNSGVVYVSWRQFNQATLQCTRGSDFWEENPGEWPVERFMLGGVLYDQQQALNIMAGSQNGNPWRLAREMIVAKLNLLSGLNDEALANFVDDADAWLIDAEWVYEGSGNGTNNNKNKSDNGKGKGNGKEDDKEKSNNSLASQLADQIELFNDGLEGPGDCSTEVDPISDTVNSLL